MKLKVMITHQWTRQQILAADISFGVEIKQHRCVHCIDNDSKFILHSLALAGNLSQYQQNNLFAVLSVHSCKLAITTW